MTIKTIFINKNNQDDDTFLVYVIPLTKNIVMYTTKDHNQD